MRVNPGRIREALAFVVLLGVLVTDSSAIGGAAPGHDVVSGSLRIFGGVADSPPHGWPTSGRVVFERVHGRTSIVGVGKSGDFMVKLKPGVYTAFGGPPGWYPQCRANDGKPFTVTASHSLKVVVACDAL